MDAEVAAPDRHRGDAATAATGDERGAGESDVAPAPAALAWWARIATAVAAAAVLWPVVGPAVAGDPARDSFPLSSYPMFTTHRDRVTGIATVVGVDTSGRTVRLSPVEIGGTDEPIHATGTVNRAVAAGAAASRALCDAVAGRLAEADDEPAGVVEVRVVTERIDTIAWLAGRHESATSTVHAACPLPGDERP